MKLWAGSITASHRISSIEDNLIPAERVLPPKALDANDKELRHFSKEVLIFFVINVTR